MKDESRYVRFLHETVHQIVFSIEDIRDNEGTIVSTRTSTNVRM